MSKPEDEPKIGNSRFFLAKTIRSMVNMSDHDMQKIIQIFEPVRYEKNHLLLKQGDVSQFLYFISKGIIKVSYFKEDKEIIDWFASEGIFIGNMLSYQTNQPVVENYETIENVELLRVKYSEVEALLKSDVEYERAARKILEQYHSNYVQRAQSLKSLSAEKKYDLFLSEFEAYSNRIPLKYIASYLGMTSETLSRVRAKYDKTSKKASNN